MWGNRDFYLRFSVRQKLQSRRTAVHRKDTGANTHHSLRGLRETALGSRRPGLLPQDRGSPATLPDAGPQAGVRPRACTAQGSRLHAARAPGSATVAAAGPLPGKAVLRGLLLSPGPRFAL